MNMEAKLREVAAAFAGNGLYTPSGLGRACQKWGKLLGHLLLGAAGQLEQRSLLLPASPASGG